MINTLFSNQPQLALEFAMGATSAKSRLIAHNIANADTPNYKAQRLKFEEFLAKELGEAHPGADLALRRTDPLHLPGHAAKGLVGTITPYGLIYTDERTTYRLDGNNVDIDQETAEQAKNAIMYSALTELVSRRFSALRTVISEGRR